MCFVLIVVGGLGGGKRCRWLGGWLGGWLGVRKIKKLGKTLGCVGAGSSGMARCVAVAVDGYSGPLLGQLVRPVTHNRCQVSVVAA